jgi:myo-inositol-1-phosphate synthase
MTNKIGVWVLGACGGVATTTVVGLAALRRGLTGNQGLVSQLPPFDSLGLLTWDQFVIGGHDIRKTTLYDEAMQLARVSRAIDASLIEKCREDLNAIDGNIRPGVLFNVGPRCEQAAATLVGTGAAARQQ